MDVLQRTKNVTIIIIVLVLLNIASLITVWIMFSSLDSKPPIKEGRERPHNAMDFITGELNLNQDQKAEIANLRNEHFRERTAIEKDILDLRKEIIKETIKPDPDISFMRGKAQAIGNDQAKLELLIHAHFNDIQSVLSQEQVLQFKALVKELLDKTPPPPASIEVPKPPPPPNDN